MMTVIVPETDTGNFGIVPRLILLVLILLLLVNNAGWQDSPGRPAPVSTESYPITHE